MKKSALRIASLILILLAASPAVFAGSAAASAQNFSPPGVLAVSNAKGAKKTSKKKTGKKSSAPSAVISCESPVVVKGKTVQMKASLKGSDAKPKFKWDSSDKTVATVDQNGLVKGVRPGRSSISASAVVDGKKLTGVFVINVRLRRTPLKNLLEKRQILSYQYSYIDDYYYTNDRECWQDGFGFGKVYDLAAPYLLFEYDYVRVFFTYENKDWMIQLWKGQYGLLFYGSEVGVYTKPRSDKKDGVFTMYGCPDQSDWLKMGTTLYHDEGGGNYVRQFTREYDDYWWCTGFKAGHLRREEPADELRLSARITFKDKKMAGLFTDGLKACGFTKGKNKNSLKLDQYASEGKDVHVKWQNISEAENTMPIKIGFGALAIINILSFFAFILSVLAFIGLGAALLFLFI